MQENKQIKKIENVETNVPILLSQRYDDQRFLKSD